MKGKPLPAREDLREAYDYDPETGVFRWRARPEWHFPNKKAQDWWNSRHAGHETGAMCRGGYIRLRGSFGGHFRTMSASRVAYFLIHGKEPEYIDHIDGNRANNAIENLRPASKSTNHMNRPGWSKSGFPKGVRLLSSGRFSARVWTGNRYWHLGTFTHLSEAEAAWATEAKKIQGAFFCERRRSA